MFIYNETKQTNRGNSLWQLVSNAYCCMHTPLTPYTVVCYKKQFIILMLTVDLRLIYCLLMWMMFKLLLYFHSRKLFLQSVSRTTASLWLHPQEDSSFSPDCITSDNNSVESCCRKDKRGLVPWRKLQLPISWSHYYYYIIKPPEPFKTLACSFIVQVQEQWKILLG